MPAPCRTGLPCLTVSPSVWDWGMVDAGVESPLGELLPWVRSVVGGVDVDALEVPEAARLVEECAEAERLLGALRVVVTATLENAAVWRREGYRSVAAWMAAKTGTAVGPAIATLEMAKLLEDLPAVAAAFRDGRLSQVRQMGEMLGRSFAPRPPMATAGVHYRRPSAGRNRRLPDGSHQPNPARIAGIPALVYCSVLRS